MTTIKRKDGRAFLEQAARYRPLPKDNESDSCREFMRRIEKHFYRGSDVFVNPLFLHHTITGAAPYDPQPKFNWGGGRQDRALLTAAHIVTDITVWPATIPAGLTVMPMCEFPGCCKFTHLGLFTTTEVRIWVNMNKEQKVRRAYMRAQFAMDEAHDAESSSPNSYYTREKTAQAIAAETKYEELAAKLENMNAKQQVALAASYLVQEQIAYSAIERMRQLYDNGAEIFDKKNPSSARITVYDQHCREVMESDNAHLQRKAEKRSTS